MGDLKPAAPHEAPSPLVSESLDPCSAGSGPEIKDYGVGSSWISHHRDSPTTQFSLHPSATVAPAPRSLLAHRDDLSGFARWALSEYMTQRSATMTHASATQPRVWLKYQIHGEPGWLEPEPHSKSPSWSTGSRAGTYPAAPRQELRHGQAAGTKGHFNKSCYLCH